MLTLTPNHKPTKLPDMIPRCEFVFETRVITGPVMVMPNMGDMGGKKFMMTIEGGDIYGPRLNGKIIPGGTEWPFIRPDGVSYIDARYTFQADDGTYIAVKNTGIRKGPPDVMARLSARQEIVDPETYYFRTNSVFEAPMGRHDWLATNTFIGVGERHPELLYLRYYLVL